MRIVTISMLSLLMVLVTNQLALAQQATFIPHKNCGLQPMTDWQIEQHPEYAEELKKYHNKIIPQLVEQSLSQDKNVATILTIPVVVHVIHNGEAIGVGANLSIAQIEAQLEVLNEDFSATNPSFNDTPSKWSGAIGNPEIQFCLAAFDEMGNPTTGVTRHDLEVTGTTIENSNIETGIKPATIWESTEYYNLWTLAIPGTTANGGTVGYAYLPTNFAVGSNFDGTVVDYRWFGGEGFSQSGYKTLTHETGHYLGLPHTFNGDSCSDDDNIADTPNIDKATASYISNLSCSTGNFPDGPTSCGNEHMYVNYMDYVNSDYCFTSFTNGQIGVMRGVLDDNPISGLASRNSLVTNATTACTFFTNDAGISQISNPESGQQCDVTTIVPEVQLTNYGTDALTTVTIRYQINTETPVDFIWTGNLIAGNSTSVSLSSYTAPAEEYTFTVSTNNPNGVADQGTSNDSQTVTSAVINPSNLPLLEDFEALAFNPTTNGIESSNIDLDDFAWERSNTVSAFGNGDGSAMFNNYDGANDNNPFNTLDALVTPVYDFSNVTNAQLQFDVAYAAWSNGTNTFGDTLIVLISTDCGNSFDQQLFKDGGNSLGTATATSSRFVPTGNQWETITIDLSNYNNVENISVAFVNYSGWGNQLFLDNIQISSPCELDFTVNGFDTNCYDSCNGSAFIAVGTSGGTPLPYTFQWEAAAGGHTSDIANNLCTGTYQVTVSNDMGCSEVATVIINQPEAIEVSLFTTDESIPGANDGTISVSATGGTPGYFYNWSNGESGDLLIGLAPGAYTLTLTDQQVCSEIVQATIAAGNVNCDAFEASIQTSNVSCSGANDGFAQSIPSNGTAPYSYFWSNGTTGNSATELSGGLVMVTVTDALGCTFISEDFITEPEALSLNMQPTDESIAGNNDGSINLVLSGGTPDYTYLWNTGSTNSSIADLAPGEYWVTVSDQNNCTIIGQASIAPGPLDCSNFINVVTEEDASCFGASDGMASLMATGGTPPYAYFWNDGHIGAIHNDLAAGVYWVTTTDNASCFFINQIQIQEPEPLALTVVGVDESFPGANDGSASAISNGGAPDYDFLWSTGATTSTIENLSSGVYVVTVSDFNGCLNIGEVQIESNPIDCSSLAVAVELIPISCSGADDGVAILNATGGVGPYTYQWQDGSVGTVFEGLAAGVYTYTIMDEQGCSLEETLEVVEPASILSNLNAINGICGNLGTASVNPQGGAGNYNFEWNTGATAPGIAIENSGVYTITISDGNGCVLIDEIEVTVSENLLEVDFVDGGLECSGDENGFIDLVIEGGTEPYEFEWNTGGTTNSLTDIGPGSYTVLVTDAEGCNVNTTIDLVAPAELMVSCLANPVSNGNDGSIQAEPIGGTGPFTYLWSTGETGIILDGLSPNTYMVTVTDANDCSSSCSVELMNTTSTSDLEGLNDLSIFPNPTNSDLNIQATFEQSQETTIQLYNVMGQKVKQQIINGAGIQLLWVLDTHAAGTYWLVIETAKGSTVRKIVLMN